MCVCVRSHTKSHEVASYSVIVKNLFFTFVRLKPGTCAEIKLSVVVLSLLSRMFLYLL